jgi:hypothetical protein
MIRTASLLRRSTQGSTSGCAGLEDAARWICLAPGCDNPIVPRKRLGTYACSGRCRKRIFDAGGRRAVITRAKEAERSRLLTEREAQRQARLPAASPLTS